MKATGTTDPSVAADPLLAEVVRRLVAAYQPERIYLFGSRARGDSGPDSDYDILIVVPDDAPPEQRSSRWAYRDMWDWGIAADVLVCPHSHFERRGTVISSLPATAIREGVLLYER